MVKMLKNVALIIAVIGFGTLFLQGCGTPKHVKETPLKFNYETDVIESRLGLKAGVSDTTNAMIGDGSLSDKKQYLKEKYSALLGVMPNDIKNYALYGFIDKWLGTPFAKKGFSEEGISSASFVQVLCSEVYNIKLSKLPREMFKSDNIELFTGQRFLGEGDLIFLRYDKDSVVSDVVLYLQNGKIITTSPKEGLAIFDLDNEYFQERYYACGRLNPKKEQ